MKVLVIGAGVSGLTSAWKCLERGHAVRVLARDPPERTTSSIAAAIWYPFEVAPEERVVPWALASLAGFRELERAKESGVVLRDGVDLFAEPTPMPRWLAGAVPLKGHELPWGVASGWRFQAPIIEMPLYLSFLRRRVEALGGEIRLHDVRSLAELEGSADAVVVCTGLGARELLDDREVFPIRGQLVHAENPGIERFRIFQENRSEFGYVIPRSRDVVLGGTAERGNESLEPDPAATRAILERCAAHEPRLAGAKTLSVEVGLRPGRSRVRLEEERTAGGLLVVHNYGHGGAGVTLSIGCAEEVVSRIERPEN